MTSLVHNLGVSHKLAFHDVFSIDDPDLLAFVPRPAYALLLVFPVSRTYEKARVEEDANRPAYSGAGPDEEVMWFKQTIRNACGLIGLLHGVANGEARKFICTFFVPEQNKPDSILLLTIPSTPPQHQPPLSPNFSNPRLPSCPPNAPISSTTPQRSNPPTKPPPLPAIPRPPRPPTTSICTTSASSNPRAPTTSGNSTAGAKVRSTADRSSIRTTTS